VDPGHGGICCRIDPALVACSRAVDYPHATRLLITADAGGSNSYACGYGKTELAELASQTG